MKQLLVLLRLMVGISMPAAGFFLFMIAEGAAQMRMRAYHESGILRRQAKEDPSEINTARYEGAELALVSFDDATGWYMAASGTGFVTSTLLCLLDMRAGGRVKRLMFVSDTPEEKEPQDASGGSGVQRA